MTPLHSTKPLSGLRVLVPRGGEWGNAIAATLRQNGATPVLAPMINFASSESAPILADALARLGSGAFDWLIVTSATTVDVLTSHEVTVPESTRVAAVGETTGTALTLAGYRVDYVPENDNSARGLIKEWATDAMTGSALILQSDVPDESLAAGLKHLGVVATFVSAYRTVAVPVATEIVDSVADGRIGAILVTSGSVARQIQAQLFPLPGGTIIVSIGPRTAFDARAAGIDVDTIAESRSADGLVEALVAHVVGLGA